MEERMKNINDCTLDYTLEVCVDSVESAIAAEQGGAHRLELCANLIIGGTTPGIHLFHQIRKHCSLPVHVLIRPRYGDFLYTEWEAEIIEKDILTFKELRADGIVIGSLCADGHLDCKRLERFCRAGAGLSLTLHRAFDMCCDPQKALEEAIELGFSSILTSGQEENCLKGKSCLKQLVRQADGRIRILAGGGVSEKTISSLIHEAGIHDFHMSGKTVLDSEMLYRKKEVHMGIAGMDEYAILRTDEEQVRLAKEAIFQKIHNFRNGEPQCFQNNSKTTPNRFT